MHRWLGRFAVEGIDGLADRDRPGRPPVFGAAVVTEVKALACQLPATTGVPLRVGAPPNWPVSLSPGRWCPPSRRRRCGAPCATTPSALGTTAPGSPLVTPTSPPRRHACWTCTRGASRARHWAATNSSYAQTRKRASKPVVAAIPTLPPGRPGWSASSTSTNAAGALAYLAAYDVHQAKVFGRCEATTGIVPFGRLVEQVMTLRALRFGREGVLGRGQRELPPGAGVGGPPARRMAHASASPPARPCLVAGPGGDLFLRGAAKSRFRR